MTSTFSRLSVVKRKVEDTFGIFISFPSDWMTIRFFVSCTTVPLRPMSERWLLFTISTSRPMNVE